MSSKKKGQGATATPGQQPLVLVAGGSAKTSGYDYGAYADGYENFWTKGKASKGQAYVSCHTTHPVLSMGKGTIRGGACSTPSGDFDVYVGLDQHSMAHSAAAYPWTDKYAFVYAIKDMSVPTDPDSFKQLIAWLKCQLLSGKNIHVGCIGGHGRTGMVLAALAKEVNDESDAITWVREHYCKKAVETGSQVDFLHEHFGIKKVEGAKLSFGGTGSSAGGYHCIKTTRSLFTGTHGEIIAVADVD